MDDNLLQIAQEDRPAKKFKISFNRHYNEEATKDIEEILNQNSKKSIDKTLLSKSIQQMKLELVAEETKKRVENQS